MTGAGIQGTTGLSGPTGVQGVTGISGGGTGLQGLTGVQGTTGIGSTGLQGTTGVQGDTGPSGGPQGSTGVQGIQGGTGAQGVTGISGGGTGVQGTTGVQGATGISGGGTGLQGETGVQGLTGSQGATGISGGGTGLQGETGVQGLTGAQGVTGPNGGGTGVQGVTGTQGVTGLQGSGSTGVQGQTGAQGVTGVGGGVSSMVSPSYNTISRYQVVDTTGEQVWLVSSSTVYTNLTWDRTGTSLTMYRDGHGHSAGNRVIVRDTNLDYKVETIDSTTLDSFTITTDNTNATDGTMGAYSLGFTFAHSGSPKIGGILSAPAGDHADVQLLSMRIRTGSRSGTTYTLTVPASAINGAGSNTSLNDCYIPEFSVKTDSDNLSAVAGTIATNISGAFNKFRFGNLGTNSISRFILAQF